MPTSQARIKANRTNARRSTGPTSAEGKERSRRNGLKHGLSGEGVVVLDEDAAEIDLLNGELQAELAPKTRLGKILVLKMAATSVRMERAARQESAAVASRVRNAVDDFDRARLNDADRLVDALGEEPRRNVRKLRRSPEGVEALIEAWQDLRDALGRDPRPKWTAWHRERAENLGGRRVEDAGSSRINALTKAIWGEFSALDAHEGADLDDEARQAWARARMVELIDAEIATLEKHYESLDFGTIEEDRAQAPDRALFDPSKEAALARRYESEASRGFFKALNELRQVEAEALDRPATTASSPRESDYAPLGSSRDRPDRAPRDPRPVDGPTRRVADDRGFEATGRLGAGDRVDGEGRSPARMAGP